MNNMNIISEILVSLSFINDLGQIDLDRNQLELFMLTEEEKNQLLEQFEAQKHELFEMFDY